MLKTSLRLFLGTREADNSLLMPKFIVLGILVICFSPFLLNLLGLDFASGQLSIDPNLAANAPAHELINARLQSLSAAFSHTILEWSAFCIALMTVFLAFSHYKIAKDMVTPIIAIAFFMAGSMDAFHTLAADRLIPAVADNRDLLPFTWVISRSLNALIIISGIAILLLMPPKKEILSSLKFVIGISLVFGLIAYLIIHFCASSTSLPKTTFPDAVFTRPYDAIPLVLFVFSGLLIYPALYKKSPSLFTHALIISSVPQVVTQLHMTFGSIALFDNNFNIAHFMKVIAYLVPLTGLVLDYIKSHQSLQYKIAGRRKNEDELRATENRWSFALESSQSGVWDWNIQSSEMYYSRHWKELLGFGEDEISNTLEEWEQRIHDDDRQQFNEKIKTHLTDSSSNFNHEQRIRCKNGQFKWFLSTGNTVKKDAYGKPLQVIGTLTDINDRKYADRLLLESEARQRTLFDSVIDGLITIDQKGTIESFNQSAVRMFGYLVKEAIGKNINILMSDEYVTNHNGYIEQYLKTGQKNIIGQVRELTGKRKNGTLFPIELAVSEMKVGENFHFVGTVRDISERKQTTEKLNHIIAEMAEQTHEISLLSEFRDLLQSCLDLDEAFEVIGRMLPSLITPFSGGLYFVDESSTDLILRNTWGSHSPQEKTMTHDACVALRRNSVYMSQANKSALFCKHLTLKDQLISLCLPLIAQGETIGLIHLQYIPEGDPKAFTEQIKLDFIDTVSKQIAIPLANLKLKQELINQSIHDPLTGLFNRRFMEATFEKELQQAERIESSVISFVMIDIDFFKKVNDSFGHEAGDFVLQKLGSILNDICRKGDIACRFGGEEFVLCLPGVSHETAIDRCKQIQQAMKNTKFKFLKKDMGHITLSLGVSAYPIHGLNMSELMRKADQALYKAKNEGRDRVVIAE